MNNKNSLIKNKGSLMIMVLLILFVSILFITASVWSVVCLNNIQKNENNVIKEQLSASALTINFDNITMYGYQKSNYRGAFDITLNNKTATGNVSFDYLHSNAKIRKYLILDLVVNNADNRKYINQKVFKPVPTFVYSHFVMDPMDNLGDDKVREECYGIVRANKEDNNFINVSGEAIQDSGKPYIYMQDIDINNYMDISRNYGLNIDTSYLNSNISLFFNDNTVLVEPVGKIYTITQNSVMTIKNNGYKVFMSGLNNNININYNITLVTDSPIVLESSIYNKDNDFIMISTFKDIEGVSAFNFNINQYINNSFILNNDININSIFYGFPNGEVEEREINRIYLKSIFIANNGSFSFLIDNYDGGIFYNRDIVNQYCVIGGILEYNSNYDMKNFDDIPFNYANIIYYRNDNFFNIEPSSQFPFISPPLSKNIFSFDSKYF